MQYFYDGLSERDHDDTADLPEFMAADIMSKKETMDLVRAYYSIGETPRKHLLDLAKSLELREKPRLGLVT